MIYLLDAHDLKTEMRIRKKERERERERERDEKYLMCRVRLQLYATVQWSIIMVKSVGPILMGEIVIPIPQMQCWSKSYCPILCPIPQHWVISISRTVFMNKNSGRIRTMSWYLIIACQSHNNKNDHLTRPRKGTRLQAGVSRYHLPSEF